MHMSHVILLRSATFNDHQQIALLHATNWQHTYRGILSDHYLNNEVIEERTRFWKERLEQPAANQITTVAVMNDAVMGFSCFLLDDNKEYGTLLDNLHVSVHAQKNGIGKMLMQDGARTILSKAGTHNMYLWVFDDNVNARVVYEKLGGKHAETCLHHNKDGTSANACRYYWEDVKTIL